MHSHGRYLPISFPSLSTPPSSHTKHPSQQETMDQPILPGEEHNVPMDEPLEYLEAVIHSGAGVRTMANVRFFPFSYLELLAPIEDLIDTLTDRQQLLIMIYFLNADAHIFRLRHPPSARNQVQIEQPSDRLQAEADEALRALIITDPQRYTDFHVELMNDYLTLLIHSDDPEDRAEGIEVLLHHLYPNWELIIQTLVLARSARMNIYPAIPSYPSLPYFSPLPPQMHQNSNVAIADIIAHLQDQISSGAVTLIGDHVQLLPYSCYLGILVPINDLIGTLDVRQRFLIIIFFLSMDTRIFRLRHNLQNRIPIDPIPDHLDAEVVEALFALVDTDAQRYNLFLVSLMNEYFTLLMHSDDPEDRLEGMDVLLEHLVNINGSELGDHPSVDACAICQDDYTPADNIIVLPCHNSHHFHRSCIETWLHRHLNCPNCRAPVRIAQRDKLHELTRYKTC
ncbi:hypothetical protein PSTT_16524 [Puccinia striiformis]|uniref:RING-type domain-containing protein n=1 Tax=Puccinia striiformis TaxID=27350 RepID=A0A2S4UCK2_9BASI|nr:hypothetical protein PSTT_16524 [Puccinia striiformis]